MCFFQNEPFLVSYEEILPLGSESREVSVKSIIKQKILSFWLNQPVKPDGSEELTD